MMLVCEIIYHYPRCPPGVNCKGKKVRQGPVAHACAAQPTSAYLTIIGRVLTCLDLVEGGDVVGCAPNLDKIDEPFECRGSNSVNLPVRKAVRVAQAIGAVEGDVDYSGRSAYSPRHHVAIGRVTINLHRTSPVGSLIDGRAEVDVVIVDVYPDSVEVSSHVHSNI